ncbi:MAG: DUF4426 domain-containing protein [Amphritea sp.]
MNTRGLSLYKRLCTLCALILIFCSSAMAEQMVSHGNYMIHYNAFNSSFLQPNVAEAYGISRSKFKALLNISVLKKLDDGSTQPVSAIVSGGVTNLISQSQALSFNKIVESNALYYLADFTFADDQVLRFNLQIQPEPDQPAYDINFEQRFYVD